MPEQYHLTPWLVMRATATGGWEAIARYRFRGDAESHAIQLKKLMPGWFTVAFDNRRVSQR